MTNKIDDTLCSFCGRGKPEIKIIIRGKIEPRKFICDECLVEATKLIKEGKEEHDVSK